MAPASPDACRNDSPKPVRGFVGPDAYGHGMRLLHTSDWHLGRSFHREGMLSAQAGFVDFLIDTVRSERVDVVLVSGDIYDRALPSVDAVALCNDALRRLAAERVPTVIISGNHDSARRLGFGADLIDAAGVHLRTDPARCGVPIVLGDRHGDVAVYGIPYLEPDAVRDCLDCDERNHAGVVAAAMGRVRADLARRAGARSVVLAHAFVTGGRACDSERDISVGGASHVPADVFAGIDYVALGHLHGAQDVGERVRYSGSPLAYSFSEAQHVKSVSLMELPPSGEPRVETVPCPVPRRLARLRGRLEELLSDRRLRGHETDFVQVTLTDAVRPPDPMRRLRERFPHTLVLEFDPEGGAPTAAGSYAALVRGRDDLEIAAGFYQHVRGRPTDDAEMAWLRHAFEADRQVEVAR